MDQYEAIKAHITRWKEKQQLENNNVIFDSGLKKWYYLERKNDSLLRISFSVCACMYVCIHIYPLVTKSKVRSIIYHNIQLKNIHRIVTSTLWGML